MRHANLKITMTYYANIDVVIEEAVQSSGSGRKPGSEKRPTSCQEEPNFPSAN